MVTKKELVSEMKKAGIEGISSGMTVKELKSIYSDFKKNKDKEEKGKEVLEKTKEKRKENIEKREAPKVVKSRFVFPDNVNKVSPKDILAEKIVDGVHTIVFKQGAKIKYDIETGKKL